MKKKALALGVGLALHAHLAAQPRTAPVHGYEIVAEYPHDREAFTQGLIVRDGVLFESTGLNGRSSLRRVRLETGEVLQRRDVARRYFAEGMTEWNGRIIQLTWLTNVAFVYDASSFDPIGSFKYRGEGWGLAHDGRRLIMSDGTSSLRFLDPETFEETGRVTVRDGGVPVDNLNELEMVNGLLYANVWPTDWIAIVEPDSGTVTGWLDMRGLLPEREADDADVLNGIAYDAEGDRLFITGKLWPRLYQIRLRPR